MTAATIYHNPRCSKSRQALAILEENSDSIKVIEYLKTGLKANELHELILLLEDDMSDLVRTNEAEFKAAPYDIQELEELVNGLVKAPKTLQRPIIIFKDKAIIGRPTQRVGELF